MNKANAATTWQSDDTLILDEPDLPLHDDSHTPIELDIEGRRREIVAKRRRLEDRLEARRLQNEFGEEFEWEDELN